MKAISTIIFLVFILQAYRGEALACAACTAPPAIKIALDRTRPQRGETVEVTVQAVDGPTTSDSLIQAVLFEPSKGTRDLVLRKVPGKTANFRAEIPLG